MALRISHAMISNHPKFVKQKGFARLDTTALSVEKLVVNAKTKIFAWANQKIAIFNHFVRTNALIKRMKPFAIK